jgi:nitroimidazol reductase NimA-like FMN-containing flavoprotein (pyridoxamine 5'-phosphate oxidase superfamily)
MRRAEKEIRDKDELLAILRNNVICHLALTDGNNPYVVPVNYGCKDGSLFIHSSDKGMKIDLIEKNARVAFEILDNYEIIETAEACRFSTRYQSLTGRGKAVILRNEREKREALDVIMEHHTHRRGWTYADAPLKKMCIIRIDIAEMTGKKSDPH